MGRGFGGSVCFYDVCGEFRVRTISNASSRYFPFERLARNKPENEQLLTLSEDPPHCSYTTSRRIGFRCGWPLGRSCRRSLWGCCLLCSAGSGFGIDDATSILPMRPIHCGVMSNRRIAPSILDARFRLIFSGHSFELSLPGFIAAGSLFCPLVQGTRIETDFTDGHG